MLSSINKGELCLGFFFFLNGKDMFAEPMTLKIKKINFPNNHYIERMPNLKLVELFKGSCVSLKFIVQKHLR